LALKVGVQPQAVYFWESGRRTPQVPQLRKLGQVFDMCSDDIELTPSRDLAAESELAQFEQSSAESGPIGGKQQKRFSASDGG
jgi:DNA-binding XRE family transcriptional regulator